MAIKGKVKWFNEQKGYGFIQLDEGRDVFVHYAALQKSGPSPLCIGQEVEFDPTARRPAGDNGNRDTTPQK